MATIFSVPFSVKIHILSVHLYMYCVPILKQYEAPILHCKFNSISHGHFSPKNSQKDTPLLAPKDEVWMYFVSSEFQ